MTAFESCQFRQFVLNGISIDEVYQCSNPACKRLIKGLPNHSIRCRAKAGPAAAGPCIYLGDKLYGLVYKCTLFDRCTPLSRLPNIVCCAACDSYIGSNLPAPSPIV